MFAHINAGIIIFLLIIMILSLVDIRIQIRKEVLALILTNIVGFFYEVFEEIMVKLWKHRPI